MREAWECQSTGLDPGLRLLCLQRHRKGTKRPPYGVEVGVDVVGVGGGEEWECRQWLELVRLQQPRSVGTSGLGSERLWGERIPLLSLGGRATLWYTRLAGGTAGWSLASQDILPPLHRLFRACVPFLGLQVRVGLQASVLGRGRGVDPDGAASDSLLFFPLPNLHLLL